MKTSSSKPANDSRSLLGPPRSLLRLWLVRITLFLTILVFLMSGLSGLGKIVEKFFVTLYVD